MKSCLCSLPSMYGPDVCKNCSNRYEYDESSYPYSPTTTPEKYPFDVPYSPQIPEPIINIGYNDNQIATLIETIRILNERIKELEAEIERLKGEGVKGEDKHGEEHKDRLRE